MLSHCSAIVQTRERNCWHVTRTTLKTTIPETHDSGFMMRSVKILVQSMLLLLALIVPSMKSPPVASGATGSVSAYIEDLMLSFQQNLPSLAFNVSAIQQCGDGGSGPLYSVAGLSNTGYWYYFGIAWNWPTSLNPISASSGFQALYFVWNSTAQMFRVKNPMPNVSDRDTVLLKLSISNDMVTMYLHDWNSSATDQENYSAFGATEFVGQSNTVVGPNGEWTGLNTRMFQNLPYHGGEQAVTYKGSATVSSAWMRIVEWPDPTKSPVVFDNYGSYRYDNPFLLQNFTSNGASVASDANTFVTGQLSSGPKCTTQGASSLLNSLPRFWYTIPFAILAIIVAVLTIRLRRRSAESWLPSPPQERPCSDHIDTRLRGTRSSRLISPSKIGAAFI